MKYWNGLPKQVKPAENTKIPKRLAWGFFVKKLLRVY